MRANRRFGAAKGRFGHEKKLCGSLELFSREHICCEIVFALCTIETFVFAMPAQAGGCRSACGDEGWRFGVSCGRLVYCVRRGADGVICAGSCADVVFPGGVFGKKDVKRNGMYPGETPFEFLRQLPIRLRLCRLESRFYSFARRELTIVQGYSGDIQVRIWLTCHVKLGKMQTQSKWGGSEYLTCGTQRFGDRHIRDNCRHFNPGVMDNAV